jgi:hypothetical protein
MVHQVLHQARQTDPRFADRKRLFQRLVGHRLTNSARSFSTSVHLNSAVAKLGNASAVNRASCRCHKSVKRAGWGTATSNTPLAPNDVNEHVSHGTKAAQVACELPRS